MLRILFVQVLLLTLILHTLDAGKVRKRGGGKKKKKDKEVVTAVKEPKMENLWNEGGYVYQPDETFSVRDDKLFRELYFSEENKFIYNLDIEPFEIIGKSVDFHQYVDAGAAMTTYLFSKALPSTYLVGYVDTHNRTLVPPALRGAECSVEQCFEFSNPTIGRYIDENYLATSLPESTPHQLQDHFLESYKGLRTSLGSVSTKKILCQESYVDSLVRSIQEEVEVKSGEVEEFMARPISFDAYQADAILPEIFDSVSARIMLKVLEGLCGL